MANSEGAKEAEADAHSGSEGPVAGVIGVIGAGTMGAGIAQLACRAGVRALLHDAIPEALERGVQRVREGLTKEAARRQERRAEESPGAESSPVEQAGSDQSLARARRALITHPRLSRRATVWT